MTHSSHQRGSSLGEQLIMLAFAALFVTVVAAAFSYSLTSRGLVDLDPGGGDDLGELGPFRSDVGAQRIGRAA